MSDPCPICPDAPVTPASHALRKPVVNPDTGSLAPASAVPCAEDAPATAVCNDGYRFPLVVELAHAPERCEFFNVKTPCAAQWAYPGLLVEFYALGHAEVTEATEDWLTLKNLTIFEGTAIGVGKPILPIPRAPDELGIFSVADDAIVDPANAEFGALSQEIRFPVMVPTTDTCEPRWKTEGRKGFCGIPLKTSADQSQIMLVGWNKVTGCLHFIPNGPENATLKVIGGKPSWEQEQVNKKIFKYTGQVQIVTIPAGMDRMHVKCWGAGGGGDGTAQNLRGGVGGFTSATIALTGDGLEPGDKLSVIVGEGISNKTTSTFGFGGAGGAGGRCGGGLSGVFKGEAEITAADALRALIVAGGGGGLNTSGGNIHGIPGNYPEAPGYGTYGPTMQGEASTAEGGGGGGWKGGTNRGGGTPVTAGGASYPMSVLSGAPTPPAGMTEISVQYALPYNSETPPGTNDIDYASGVGRSTQQGRVVIEFFAAIPTP